MKPLEIEDFLLHSQGFPILDVRSPGEFSNAHIPGAISFPLFSDDQRKEVGTTYKQVSREAAIKIGLDFFGPSMRTMVEKAEEIALHHHTKKLFVHCWRGGMRSAAMAWLLNLYGFEVYMLRGGYKSFRTWVLAEFAKERTFIVLGGYTGSGKTALLHSMAKSGQLIIDLEGLAHHKGSAFGHLGQEEQPSVEMFENQLSIRLWNRRISNDGPVWLEAESQRIGRINLPNAFFQQVKDAPVLFLDIPFEQRLERIVAEYGRFEKEALVQSVMRIRKRLGGLETKNCISFLIEDNLKDAFAILLRYYDKWYDKSTFQNRPKIYRITTETADIEKNKNLILDWTNQHGGTN